MSHRTGLHYVGQSDLQDFCLLGSNSFQFAKRNISQQCMWVSISAGYGHSVNGPNSVLPAEHFHLKMCEKDKTFIHIFKKKGKGCCLFLKIVRDSAISLGNGISSHWEMLLLGFSAGRACRKPVGWRGLLHMCLYNLFYMWKWHPSIFLLHAKKKNDAKCYCWSD